MWTWWLISPTRVKSLQRSKLSSQGSSSSTLESQPPPSKTRTLLSQCRPSRVSNMRVRVRWVFTNTLFKFYDVFVCMCVAAQSVPFKIAAQQYMANRGSLLNLSFTVGGQSDGQTVNATKVVSLQPPKLTVMVGKVVGDLPWLSDTYFKTMSLKLYKLRKLSFIPPVCFCSRWLGSLSCRIRCSWPFPSPTPWTSLCRMSPWACRGLDSSTQRHVPTGTRMENNYKYLLEYSAKEQDLRYLYFTFWKSQKIFSFFQMFGFPGV